MIRLEISGLPPSSNNAYVNNGFGGRTLSKDGRKFLNETKAHFAQRYPLEMRIFKPNVPYGIAIVFYFTDLENAGFAAGKAKSRYKKADGGNRTKLLEDALKEAGGVDDSQTLISVWEKRQGTEERTVIFVWALEEESSPFYELLKKYE